MGVMPPKDCLKKHGTYVPVTLIPCTYYLHTALYQQGHMHNTTNSIQMKIK